MRIYTRQSGFSAIEAVLIVVVVVLLGLGGYFVYHRQHSKTSSSQSAVAQDVSTAPDVNSTSDLDQALSTLDQTDTNSNSDSTELDSQLQNF